MKDYVIGLRRELHMCAEVGTELDETLAVLRRELDDIGVSYTEEYGKSSIVATVNPEKSHFTIGVRADIDGLPIIEENDIPYKSKNVGKMHACGHDAHAAIAMTTLREIYAMRDKIDCRVKFLFQSSEEAHPSGAKMMAEDGVMDDIDCIIALHVDGGVDVGCVASIAGGLSANSDGIVLEFFGKSAHAAQQYKGVDAIMMAVHAYTQIEFMMAKEVSGTAIFNVGSIHGGETNNVVCNQTEMYATIRTLDDDVREKILKRINDICEGVAKTMGGEYRITHTKCYPSVINNEKMHELFLKSAAKILPPEKIQPYHRSLGGEDFSYFARLKPGYMFRLGTKNSELGIVPIAHTSTYNIDENALPLGVELFKQFILDNMGGIEF